MREKLYGTSPEDGHRADSGYRITERAPGTWRWVWTEPDEEDEVSDPYASASEAFAAAAADWDSSGEGGKLSATLRAQATRLRNNGR
ncbi:Uncharacterised protein (plasmid) [Tsukamurella tyrosinosolvens]|uniref:Uncharacterized protein n=1 Tax=Tsukamurella tyrosinosolvens TaxID=57704 RepID=A0A1H4UFQ6_TSUTY|nr:hypothetical protein [Tsukamurella tyrosinosolvens]KXO92930.1 hypothetical protein AXK58_13750 [Tsukamurella tyrosinosolvens]SEC67606.1 hypothetical protein SAMN04489793_2888 [Tsukamurella tyrosinosolvens]VEH94197.1 Uncharacterised protein [Tsukamurella tyrosinosolvens]